MRNALHLKGIDPEDVAVPGKRRGCRLLSMGPVRREFRKLRKHITIFAERKTFIIQA